MKLRPIRDYFTDAAITHGICPCSECTDAFIKAGEAIRREALQAAIACMPDKCEVDNRNDCQNIYNEALDDYQRNISQLLPATETKGEQ